MGSVKNKKGKALHSDGAMEDAKSESAKTGLESRTEVEKVLEETQNDMEEALKAISLVEGESKEGCLGVSNVMMEGEVNSSGRIESREAG